ncbi:hypothetical protein APHAL10511_003933 [Amanita phalloides]|nr:hypothetical protein APHAL10511_003933 [Amanita phalloides]
MHPSAFVLAIAVSEDEEALEQIEYHEAQILAWQAKQRKSRMEAGGIEILKHTPEQSAPWLTVVEPSTSQGPSTTNPLLKGKEQEVVLLTSDKQAPAPASSAAPAAAAIESDRHELSTCTAVDHPFKKA